MRNSLFVAVIIACLAQGIYAQNYGCVNRVEVLSAMPETMQANIAIAKLHQAYQEKSKAMILALQTEYAEAQKTLFCGSKENLEKFSTKFLVKQEETSLFLEEIKLDLEDRKSDLFKPIHEKLNAAISEVAEENGMDVIFDQGAELVLYAEQGADITSKVKIKLGL